MDTIYAPATARGRAGVAIVRISGPEAFSALRRLTGDVPARRSARLRRLRAADGTVLDDALILTFDAGYSFTGEPTVELHLHGSLAVVSAVQTELSRMPGLRMAEAGEFTRRALENDRLDLTQVEGLADLIDAETEMQRIQAQRVLSGAIGRLVEGWRRDLIRAGALLEASIDFADEDVPVDVIPEVTTLLDGVIAELDREAKGSLVAERLRDGFEVAIVGPPNVGKSTLLNTLAGRDAAITSEHAGTTRDVIEVRMDLNGLPVTFLDTAGLREAQDMIEAVGVARTFERASTADLRIALVSTPRENPGLALHEDDLLLVAKDDQGSCDWPSISGKTGHGVDILVNHVIKTFEARASGIGSAVRERHRFALSDAGACLRSARDALMKNLDSSELAAADIRAATGSLSLLMGHVDVEDMLDVIFSSFCIGK